MTKPKEKDSNSKPYLKVTVSFHPQKWQHFDWLMGAVIEFEGTYWDNPINTKTSFSMGVIFENKKNGNEFLDMITKATEPAPTESKRKIKRLVIIESEEC